VRDSWEGGLVGCAKMNGEVSLYSLELGQQDQQGEALVGCAAWLSCAVLLVL
jgi:hypothetical protein